MSSQPEYEVREVRVEGDTALLILASSEDSFGVYVPYEQIRKMTDEELSKFLADRVNERLSALEQVRRLQEENLKKTREIERIRGMKVKIKQTESQSEKQAKTSRSR